MTTLFDTDSPPEPAPPDLVRALVEEWGYSPDKVRTWTRQRAATVLAKRRRDGQRDAHHAAATAAAQGEGDGAPPVCELAARLDAAVYVEQALAARDLEAIVIALTYAMYPLHASEVRQMAHLVALQLRLHPLSGDPIGTMEGEPCAS